uniref:Membrane magnesium transporter n=1 Tax=Trypanosoma congolense (strain IL3000) TaxID=1068625 RepID=G0UL70_TRYCI|nr:hypothetical protein, unlikely [Trypanosoma congolense IL3000]
MVLFQRLLFPIGILLLMHSLYLAFNAREELQDYHHSGTKTVTGFRYFPMILWRAEGATHASGTVIYIFFELLLSVLVSIIGYVKRSTFKPARLIDQNCFDRYDSVICTGMGFMHFNHRGAGTAKRGGKTPVGSGSGAPAAKKNV